MNCRRETMKMGVPARHREPARSGEAGGPPGNRRGQKNDRLSGATSRRSRERRKRVEESRRQGTHFRAVLTILTRFTKHSKFPATSTYWPNISITLK